MPRIEQAAVGRAQKPEVRPAPDVASDALVHPLLDHAKQLGLQRRRQLADFVEKERPAVGHRERAFPRRHGAGERSLLVAEELRSGQRGNDRRAVHDEKLALPRPGVEGMNQPGHAFLSGSALARDQHERVGEAGDLDDVSQHGAPGGVLADEVLGDDRRAGQLLDRLPTLESRLDLGRDLRTVRPGKGIGRAGLQQSPVFGIAQRSGAEGDGEQAVLTEAAGFGDLGAQSGRGGVKEECPAARARPGILQAGLDAGGLERRLHRLAGDAVTGVQELDPGSRGGASWCFSSPDPGRAPSGSLDTRLGARRVRMEFEFPNVKNSRPSCCREAEEKPSSTLQSTPGGRLGRRSFRGASGSFGSRVTAGSEDYLRVVFRISRRRSGCSGGTPRGIGRFLPRAPERLDANSFPRLRRC